MYSVDTVYIEYGVYGGYYSYLVYGVYGVYNVTKEDGMGKLTDEQIEKAATVAHLRFCEVRGYRENTGAIPWKTLPIAQKNDWKDAVEAAAPHLQYAPEPPQIAGDVIEQMLREYYPDPLKEDLGAYNRNRMTAAAKKLLDAYEACAQETWDQTVCTGSAGFLAAVRAKLERPKSAEERVKIRPHTGHEVFIVLDGNNVACVSVNAAEWCRLGLIAQLKAEGR